MGQRSQAVGQRAKTIRIEIEVAQPARSHVDAVLRNALEPQMRQVARLRIYRYTLLDQASYREGWRLWSCCCGGGGGRSRYARADAGKRHRGRLWSGPGDGERRAPARLILHRAAVTLCAEVETWARACKVKVRYVGTSVRYIEARGGEGKLERCSRQLVVRKQRSNLGA